MHLQIPFKGAFEHAQKSRSVSDTLLVRIDTAAGHTGWGEILARSYVTGETSTGIMNDGCEWLAQRLLGRVFEGREQLSRWLESELRVASNWLALIGGVELALWQCLMQEHGLDLLALLGPVRTSEPGRCITVGFDAALDALRARAIDARFKQATTVKLKVGLGLAEDLERIKALSSHLGDSMPLRLDANGILSPDTANELLEACRKLPLSSFEQPFDVALGKLEQHLKRLYARHEVPLMADESVCSLADAEYWAGCGAYQLFNIRIGKHGGLLASRQVRDCAENHGLKCVAGSMVGESSILSQASSVLLQHSENIPYVEGLEQNRRWLKLDPVISHDTGPSSLATFHFRELESAPLVRSVRDFS